MEKFEKSHSTPDFLAKEIAELSGPPGWIIRIDAPGGLVFIECNLRSQTRVAGHLASASSTFCRKYIIYNHFLRSIQGGNRGRYPLPDAALARL